jgi:hypothetical protein
MNEQNINHRTWHVYERHPLTGHERDTAEIASNLDHVQVRE